MLHIVQVGNYLTDPSSGVAKKTFGLVRALRAAGCKVEVHAVVDLQQHPSAEDVKDVHFTFCDRRDRATALESVLADSTSSNDMVLLRYPWASEAMLSVVNSYGGRIVFEHNTDEEAEALLLQREHLQRSSASFSLSYLRYWFRTRCLQRTEESEYGPHMLQAVRGGICMTEELSRRQRARFATYKTTVIANGCEMAAAVDKHFQTLNDELRVIMLIGAPAPWHGLDRAIEGLKNVHEWDARIRLDVIGVDSPEEKMSDSRTEVRYLGRLSDDEIERRLSEYHLGIGTLALHRKGMREACPLKVRQCLAAGIPMVLAYSDTDISEDSALRRFTHHLEADDSPVDWGGVVAFYRQLCASSNSREQLLEAVQASMSVESKAQQMILFFESLGFKTR
ncbi:MAG: hypothetical protein ACKOZY_02290 [Flavobacteriales bacterium]